MYLLDTCTISDFIKNHEGTQLRIQAAPKDAILVSSLSVMELYYGLAVRQHPSLTLKNAIDHFLANAHVLAFDTEIAEQTGQLRALLRRKGVGIGAYDLLIAATALAFGLTLVTSNEREFQRVPHLNVQNWRK